MDYINQIEARKHGRRIGREAVSVARRMDGADGRAHLVGFIMGLATSSASAEIEGAAEVLADAIAPGCEG